MRRAHQRPRMLAPLVHLAALVLLVEAWFWETGSRIAAGMARWGLVRWLENRVRVLPPWAALSAFVLPGLLLFPVKLLALLAIAHGHAVSGVLAFVVAKLGGAVVVARIYVLTLPTLLTLGWFARCHGGFLALRDRWLTFLRASSFWRSTRAMAAALRRNGRRLMRRAGRQPSHLARVLRRFTTRFRARRQMRRHEQTNTERP